VRELCAGEGFPFADRGEFVVKGFEEPVRMFQVVITGGGFTASELGLRDGSQQIRLAW
jgi:class 3 adenylate cyclase